MRGDGERLCLATVTSDAFVPGTVALVHSFLRHNPGVAADIVVIHDGLEDPKQATIAALWDRIRFHPVGRALRAEIDRAVATYPALADRRARLHSIEAFALTGYRKVLFCDSDLLFRSGVEELFRRPEALLCCADASIHRGNLRDWASYGEQAPGSLPEGTDVIGASFNAGLMMIDRSLLNGQEHCALVALVGEIEWDGMARGHTDQAILNRCFDGRQTLIDPSYNLLMAINGLLETRCGLRVQDARVIHFNGPDKPWLAGRMAARALKDPAYLAAGRMWNEVYWEALGAAHLRRLGTTLTWRGDR